MARLPAAIHPFSSGYSRLASFLLNGGGGQTFPPAALFFRGTKLIEN